MHRRAARVPLPGLTENIIGPFDIIRVGANTDNLHNGGPLHH
jgi:hypothetical protein